MRSKKPTITSDSPIDSISKKLDHFDDNWKELVALIKETYAATVGPLPVKKMAIPCNWMVIPGGLLPGGNRKSAKRNLGDCGWSVLPGGKIPAREGGS